MLAVKYIQYIQAFIDSVRYLRLWQWKGPCGMNKKNVLQHAKAIESSMSWKSFRCTLAHIYTVLNIWTLSAKRDNSILWALTNYEIPKAKLFSKLEFFWPGFNPKVEPADFPCLSCWFSVSAASFLLPGEFRRRSGRKTWGRLRRFLVLTSFFWVALRRWHMSRMKKEQCYNWEARRRAEVGSN